MRAGRLVFQGPLEELRRTDAARIRVQTAQPAAAEAVLRRLGLADVELTGEQVSARLGTNPPERICTELVHAGVAVRDLGVVTPSLEELFVGLTGEGFDVHD